MSEEADDHWHDLLTRIGMRRFSIDDYLKQARPRGNRLVTVAVVSSAIAAVLTAGPAVGGESFTSGVASGLGLSNASLVWRGLCLLALLVSIVAAVTTNLARSQDTERKIAMAETANVELEGLQTAMEFGHTTVDDVVRQYHQCIAKIPWVQERHPEPANAGAGAPDGGPGTGSSSA